MPLSTLVRRALSAALVMASLSIISHPAVAQKAHAASGDKDAQTLANYRLSETGLRKYYQAMENLGKAAMKDSSLADALDNDSSSGDEDIAAMAAKYDKVPALKSAMSAAGVTSTEFATFSMSYMQAAMAYALMTQGPQATRIKTLPKGTPKENVDFVRDHQALIQQLDKQLKAMQPPGDENLDA